MRFESASRIGGWLLLVCCTVPMAETTGRGEAVPAHQEGVVEISISKPSESEIVVTRVFAANREVLFATLTQPEHLVHWMEASNMALVACEVDLRVGGALRYVYRRPNGAELEVRGVYETVDPPNRFVYTETYDFSPLEILTATVLETSGETTILTQTLVYPSKEQRDEDFEGVAASATEAYARLDRYLARIGQ